MRLIDADALREDILHDNTFDNDTVNYYMAMVDGMETSFDVDRIVEILNNEAHMLYSLQAFEPVKAWRNEYLIPVVKAGGTMTLTDILKGAVKDE